MGFLLWFVVYCVLYYIFIYYMYFIQGGLEKKRAEIKIWMNEIYTCGFTAMTSQNVFFY